MAAPPPGPATDERLFTAAHNDQLSELVRLAFTEKVDPNIRNANGSTAVDAVFSRWTPPVVGGGSSTASPPAGTPVVSPLSYALQQTLDTLLYIGCEPRVSDASAAIAADRFAYLIWLDKKNKFQPAFVVAMKTAEKRLEADDKSNEIETKSVKETMKTTLERTEVVSQELAKRTAVVTESKRVLEEQKKRILEAEREVKEAAELADRVIREQTLARAAALEAEEKARRTEIERVRTAWATELAKARRLRAELEAQKNSLKNALAEEKEIVSNLSETKTTEERLVGERKSTLSTYMSVESKTATEKCELVQRLSLRLELTGHHLDKKDTFGKSDPFIKFQSTPIAGGESKTVFTSDVIKNTLDPVWTAFEVPLGPLCGGIGRAPFKIEVYDWDKTGECDLIGEVTVNCDQLFMAASGRRGEFPLIHPGKKAKGGKYENSGVLRCASARYVST